MHRVPNLLLTFAIIAGVGLATFASLVGGAGASAQTQPAQPFTLTMTTDKATYPPGQAVRFHLMLTYTGDAPLELNFPSSPFSIRR